jgi:hypothetical protein
VDDRRLEPAHVIRVLGFLDVSKVAAAFTLKFNEQLVDVMPGVREIPLRISTEDGFEDTETLADWRSAKAFLQRLKNEVAAYLRKPVEIEEARVVVVDPESHIPWGASDRTKDINVGRVLINLVPSPAAAVFCGLQQATLWPGQVAVVEHRMLNSMVNLGRVAAVYLAVDVRMMPTPLLDGPDDE